MSEESESAARGITVALKELIRIADEGKLPMVGYLLNMALSEAQAREEGGVRPNVIPFPTSH